jgi:hypothetical protein
MVADISEVFRSYLTTSLGPDLDGNERAAAPDYGISATLATNGAVNLTLTFKSGRPYCCDGWKCHLWLFTGERWTDLRKEASSQQVELPALLSLLCTVIIEEGALFYDLSQPESEQPAGRRFTATDSRYEYSDEVYEGDTVFRP